MCLKGARNALETGKPHVEMAASASKQALKTVRRDAGEAVRTVSRNLATSVLRRSLSLDNDRADV